MTVTDYHNHESPIAGALVELFQLSTLSGPSLLLLDQQETDAEVLIGTNITFLKCSQGVAYFKVEANGKYSVRISRDGFLSTEDQITLNCSQFHCSACNPELKPQLKAEFCKDKSLILAVLDAVTNLGVAGATVQTWIEVNSERDGIVSRVTNKSGIAVIPLNANGFYQFEVWQAGFTRLSKDFKVDVPQGSCAAYQPIMLAPLSPLLPPTCRHGLRASLAWTIEDTDLDLYSWRVDNNNTENTCLTYFCDGKDPCSGITHDIDSKAGGLNGSETITYCNYEDFVHMIYVDGGNLRWKEDSTLQLNLQGEEMGIEVVGRPANSIQLSKRYWLAGCLLLQPDGQFTFTEVNLFFTDQPSVKQPDHCYNLVKLRRLQEKKEGEVLGEFTVNLRTDQPLSEATVELRLASGMTRYLMADENGQARFSGLNPGHLTVTVHAQGHQPAVVDTVFSCRADLHCKDELELHLLPNTEPGSLQISLLGRPEDEMELHLVEINEDGTTSFCQTFYRQPESCEGTNYSKISGGELISLSDPASRPLLTYMVFVKDTSTTSAGFDNHSEVRLAVSYEGNVKTRQLFKVASSSYKTYWLAGCLKVLGDNFVFVEVDTFSRISPLELDRLTCVGLLKTKVAKVSYFCPEVSLTINTVDSATRSNVKARVALVREDGDEEEEVDVPISFNQIPIKANGLYKIMASALGYLNGFQEVKVACDLSQCSQCQPTVEVVLVKPLLVSSISMTLIAPHQSNLQKPDSIHLLKLSSELMSVIKSDDPDVQSVRVPGFKEGLVRNTSQDVHYLLAVELANEKEDNPNNLGIVITDQKGEELRVEMGVGSRHRVGRFWMVGCLAGGNITAASFAQVGILSSSSSVINIVVYTQVNVMMDTLAEATDLCRPFLLSRQRDCLANAKGPGFTIEEATDAEVQPTHTASIPRDCSLACIKQPNCTAWSWDEKEGCQLYTGGKLSGYLAGKTSFAGTCI